MVCPAFRQLAVKVSTGKNEKKTKSEGEFRKSEEKTHHFFLVDLNKEPSALRVIVNQSFFVSPSFSLVTLHFPFVHEFQRVGSTGFA